MALTRKTLDSLIGQWSKSAADSEESSQERASRAQLQGFDSQDKLVQGQQTSDLALRNLLQGKQFDEGAGQRNIDANTARVREEMRRNGIDPTRASMNFNESGGGYNPDPDSMGKAVKKALMESNITGFNVADPSRVIPSTRDAEEIKLAAGGLKTLQGSGASLQEKLKSASGLDRFGSVRIPFTDKQIGTDAGVGIESDLTAMKLQQKELDKLGALSGPDMRMIDEAFGSITGIGAMFGDKEAAARKVQAVLDRAKQRVEANATARGYTPQSGYLDPAGASTKQPPSFEEWKRMKAGK